MKLDERTLLITKSGFRINFDVGVMKEETPICILWLAVAGDFVWLLMVDVSISHETIRLHEITQRQIEIDSHTYIHNYNVDNMYDIL